MASASSKEDSAFEALVSIVVGFALIGFGVSIGALVWLLWRLLG